MEVTKKTFLFGLLCLTSCSAHISNSGEPENDENFLLNLIWKCGKSKNLGNCIKLKASTFLDELVQMKEPLVINEYISLAKDPKAVKELNLSKSEFENSPRSEDGESDNLDKLLWDKLVSLFTTRTIQLNLSPDVFEGRGKEGKIYKKGHGVFIMAAMMGGMMMKMAMAKIAVIATKALVIGKVALVLSLIIALKKIVSHGGGGGHSEVVYTSSEHGHGRKFETDGASELAYSAQKPEAYNTLK